MRSNLRPVQVLKRPILPALNRPQNRLPIEVSFCLRMQAGDKPFLTHVYAQARMSAQGMVGLHTVSMQAWPTRFAIAEPC